MLLIQSRWLQSFKCIAKFFVNVIQKSERTDAGSYHRNKQKNITKQEYFVETMIRMPESYRQLYKNQSANMEVNADNFLTDEENSSSNGDLLLKKNT